MEKMILLALLMNALFPTTHTEPVKKMKLYSFCSPSHYEMRDDWFLATVPDEFDVIIDDCVQLSPSGEFMSPGFTEMMLKKVELIERAIQENWGDVFVYADIDIQFFGPFADQVRGLMKNYDLLAQKNDPKNELCAGFMVIRGNHCMANFWRDVRMYMLEHDLSFDDQTGLNDLIKKRRPKKRWAFLPDSFFGGGRFTGTVWTPGMDLYVPQDIIIHHANYVIGVRNKIEQMRYVRERVEERA